MRVCVSTHVHACMCLHRCMHADVGVYMHVEMHVCAGVWGLREV